MIATDGRPTVANAFTGRTMAELPPALLSERERAELGVPVQPTAQESIGAAE